MPKTNAEMCRQYRLKKKYNKIEIKKNPAKSSTERSREFRARKKQLLNNQNIRSNISVNVTDVINDHSQQQNSVPMGYNLVNNDFLKAESLQSCDFCDQVFYNRFSSIVHNSSHIIIPLLKDQIQYCEICCLYFTSTKDFNTHMSNNHPVTSHYNNDIKSDIQVPEIKLEKLPQLNDTFEVKQEIFNEDEDSLSSDDKPLCEISGRGMNTNYMSNEFENEEEYTDFIRSKLKFEVDHEYSGLLKDFTTDCEVKIQYEWCNNENENNQTYFKNKKGITNIVYEDPVDFKFNNAIVSNVSMKSDKYESVHYTDLMCFGVFNCKYCSLAFANRFSLIIHETTHIRINKVLKKYPQCPQCDRYLVGNNSTESVNGTVSQNKELQTCEKCRFPRTYLISNHQNTYELRKGSRNKNIRDLVQKPVQKSEWFERSSIMKVCHSCYSFFRNSFKKEYILKGTFSDNTKRPCDECKHLFLELKTVKTITRIHRSRINRACDRRRCTNEKRLKNIQIRLKMINKLAKFYDDS